MFKKQKNDYSIFDALKDRENKTYMKHINREMKDFSIWLDKEVKYKLKETSRDRLAYINISGIRESFSYGNNIIDTGSITYELYDKLIKYLKFFCDKYEFELTEEGYLNSSNGYRNGVDIYIDLMEK